MRLIDADLIQYEPMLSPKGNGQYEEVSVAYKSQIDDLPTIERKKGKWIAKEDRPKQEVFICSECGGWAYSPWIGSRKNPKPNRCKYNYCPNCGADMKKEEMSK